MNKEEIREGIAGMIKSFRKPRLADVPFLEDQVVCNIMAFLAENGVVIKVDRECFQCDGKGYTKIESTCPVCRGKKIERCTEELI